MNLKKLILAVCALLWLPLFGANRRGDFVGMPTCWPFDERSNPVPGSENLIMLDIDLLLQKKTLSEIHHIVSDQAACSVPGVTFQAQLSDREGNVLQIIPGQGNRYLEKPKYSVLTNFSPSCLFPVWTRNQPEVLPYRI